MLWNKNKAFCDIHPICYAISEQKEICRRHLKNLMDKEKMPVKQKQKNCLMLCLAIAVVL